MESRIPPGFRSSGAREMVYAPPGSAAAERAYRDLALSLGVRPDAPSLRRDDLSPEDARHVALMAGLGLSRDRLVTVPPRRR